jgi:predicted metal-dependent TIM-barrel fold hydrolase
MTEDPHSHFLLPHLVVGVAVVVLQILQHLQVAQAEVVVDHCNHKGQVQELLDKEIVAELVTQIVLHGAGAAEVEQELPELQELRPMLAQEV